MPEAVTRVLFVIDYYRDPHAGTEGQLFRLVQGLDRNKFEPHLLVFEESPWLKDNGFPCDWSVLGHRSLRSPATWAALFGKARRFRKQGFRLAHVFFNDPSVICPPVFRLCGIKTLLSRRDMGYWYTPGLKRVLRVTGWFAAGVVANSQAVRDITVQAEGFSVDEVHVIYNGYEETGGGLPATDKAELVGEESRNDLKIMVLVANLRPIKRIEDAIEGLAMLSTSHPALNLVVIGSGDPASLTALASQKGVASKVHFPGARNDVNQCLASADVGILCSESEGFSNALVEYMKAGLAVVCSAVGGNPEAVSHGVNGLLYHVGDVNAFATCVQSLLDDPGYARAMAEQAQQDARERFSLQAMVQSHQSLYSQVNGL
ncbi:glycosyltransferase [Marinobacter flavimaris]|uniref:glycosyltransferase n=1 Tax=Marinobacter flavimaris TaxID=262076 RepID=UPI00386DBFCE